MKILEEMVEVLSKQINEELFSAYLYQSMSIWANGEDLPGMSSWLSKQADEEVEHAKRLHQYITERGGRTILAQIAAPLDQWDSPLAAMEAALAHEEHISANFQKLSKMANEAGDYTTLSALQWFVDEQVEEEDSTGYWIGKLRLAGDNQAALLFIDQEMGLR